ncbi:MAG TPA: hypothetical protein DDW55_00800, partial [Gammaproteobacteria bacterium]|nr:hypothetical protein [Gammaproteobacteria bacterium]
MSTKGLKTILVSLGMLTLPATETIAQDSAGQDADAALRPPAEASEELRNKIVSYLESDIFITEGFGLKKVHLGQSMTDLI